MTLVSKCKHPPLIGKSVEPGKLICIFVLVSKVFNESWRRPVWQIRWALYGERRGELWRRLRLKPEAQRRADQHLRQRVAKLCKSLSLFLLSVSAAFFFVSFPAHPAQVSSIILQFLPHPCIDSEPCTDLCSEPTDMPKCQIRPTFLTKAPTIAAIS